MIGQLSEVALAIATTSCFVGPRRHEGAHATSGLYDTAPFQFRINFCDGIRINPQIDRQLSHRRQLVADAEFARRNRKANRAVELVIERRWVFDINLKHRFTIVLRQWDNTGFTELKISLRPGMLFRRADCGEAYRRAAAQPRAITGSSADEDSRTSPSSNCTK